MAKRKPSPQPNLPGFEDPPAAMSRAAEPIPAAAPEPIDPAAPLAGRTVWIVDAHALLYQVFHALPEMSSPSGEPVGAIHGFTRDLFDILENRQPDYLLCAFDAPGDNFRHELYEAYKEHREEMPADLQLQIPQMQRLLAALGIPMLSEPGYEADDILATVARIVEEAGGACVLVTSDKDCRQCLTPRVRMYNIRKNAYFDTEALAADWGVRPDQVVDFQGLVGDSTDNVPGVPLIGPKIARELLERYGTLDEVLAHAAEVNGKKRSENLQVFREQALLSRELARLDTDVPLDINWLDARVGGINRQATLALFEEFGFRSLGERLRRLTVQDAPSTWRAEYHAVTTPEQFAELLALLAERRRFSFDTETTDIRPRFAEIVGYSFAVEEGTAWYVPVRAPEGAPHLDSASVLEQLRPLLEDAAMEKIGQNLKYEEVLLLAHGVRLRGVAFDTMVADYLLEPGQRIHKLDDLAKRYLNHATIPISALIGSGRSQRRMDEVPLAEITEYAAEDADVPLRLEVILHRRLREEGLEPLYRDVEIPLIEVLAALEFTGIRIDVARLAELSRDYGERMEVLRGEIYAAAGREFNIDSPKQLAEILFHELGLPTQRRTKTGHSTDAEVLESLAAAHPLPAKVLEYRQYGKLKGTYLDALPLLRHPETGRVHSSFHQDVAATGRLSSADPNLQNIPVRTETGREIRSAFIPGPEGWLLMAADYSQIELRVLAHFCGDATLREAFAAEEDIHARVASEVYGVPLAEVAPAQRRSAKAINFGVIYGQTPFGLARSLGIDKEAAAEFIEAYFARYPGVDRFIDRVLEECREKGYVTTMLGRRRPISGIRARERREGTRFRTLPERTAVNTVIQGSAADLIKLAMLRVHRRLEQEAWRAKMLLQIHDELVFELPPEEVEPLSRMLVEEMASVGALDVPLKIDVKAGPNWLACEPMEP